MARFKRGELTPGWGFPGQQLLWEIQVSNGRGDTQMEKHTRNSASASSTGRDFSFSYMCLVWANRVGRLVKGCCTVPVSVGEDPTPRGCPLGPGPGSRKQQSQAWTGRRGPSLTVLACPP